MKGNLAYSVRHIADAKVTSPPTKTYSINRFGYD
jgi:hypothetical protein